MTKIDNVKVHEDNVQLYSLAGVQINGQDAHVISGRAGANIAFIEGAFNTNELATILKTNSPLGDEVILTITLRHANYVAPPPKPVEDEIQSETSASFEALPIETDSDAQT